MDAWCGPSDSTWTSTCPSPKVPDCDRALSPSHSPHRWSRNQESRPKTAGGGVSGPDLERTDSRIVSNQRNVLLINASPHQLVGVPVATPDLRPALARLECALVIPHVLVSLVSSA